MSFKLEDIAEFQKGFAFKSKDFTEEGRLIVKVSNLTDSTIDKNTCVRIPEEIANDYAKYELLEDDIIITTVGSWPTNPASVVGKVIKVPKDINKALLNQNAVRVRATTKSNQKYLYYMLRSNDFKHYIVNTAQGSANQASITQIDIKNFKFQLPAIEEQKAIAKILSDLDNKIEVNNKINQRLEEMAQSIFKNWFVDFEFPNEEGKPYKSSGGEMVESELGMIPKGWEVTQLGEISNVSSGKRPKKKSKEKTEECFIPLIGASSIMGYADDVLYYENILIIGRVGTHGVVQRVYYKSWPSDNTLVIKSKYYEYVYQILNSIDYKGLNVGSTQPLITQTDIKNTEVLLPDSDNLNRFEVVVGSLFNNMKKNNIENEKLANLRETLLPKLMSREIRVPLKR